MGFNGGFMVHEDLMAISWDFMVIHMDFCNTNGNFRMSGMNFSRFLGDPISEFLWYNSAYNHQI